MEILGLIPARGGSKAIPNKNIAPLAGRPLLAYTCEAGLSSKKLTRVVLSTDSPHIAEVGRQCGVEVPFMRPAELAQDDTPILNVLQHTLRMLQETEGYQAEVIVLLQPTSPLRRPEHIDAAADILLRTGADSVVSVIQVPHQFSPVSLMRLEGNRLVPFLQGPLILRRQEKPPVYARNGPVVLAVRTEELLERNSLYGNDCRALVMDKQSSVDVDEPFDLEFAEFILTRLRRADANQK